MKLIIEIPEEKYKHIQEEQWLPNRLLIEKAIANGTPLDDLRAEIEKAVWEDVVVSLDGTDEVRIPRLDPDDVFEIIDKYREDGE
jgi:molybdenum cofactor biosynthesis enzyme MoaA